MPGFEPHHNHHTYILLRGPGNQHTLFLPNYLHLHHLVAILVEVERCGFEIGLGAEPQDVVVAPGRSETMA